MSDRQQRYAIAAIIGLLLALVLGPAITIIVAISFLAGAIYATRRLLEHGDDLDSIRHNPLRALERIIHPQEDTDE